MKQNMHSIPNSGPWTNSVDPDQMPQNDQSSSTKDSAKQTCALNQIS